MQNILDDHKIDVHLYTPAHCQLLWTCL